MVNNCFSLLRKGARIVLIGLPKEAIHIEDPLPNVVFKSLTLTTVHGRKIFHTWEQCEALVKEGKVNNFLQHPLSFQYSMNALLDDPFN